MSINRKIASLTVAVVIIAIIGSALAVSATFTAATNAGPENQPPADRPAPPWMANLTDTQKEKLKQKMEELKTAGKTPQEIHRAMDDMLKQWGIQVPQPPVDRPDPPWMANLTDTQKAELEQKMKELKEAGKTPQEIHSAIADMLKQWGIEVPQPPSERPNPP